MTVRDKMIEDGKSKVYVAPRLTVYGDMSALTAAGSKQTVMENDPATSMNAMKNRI